MGKVYNNGIITTAGFQYNANYPLDDRLVVKNYEDLSSLNKYSGMIVYVESLDKHYKYSEKTDWSEFGTGSSGSSQNTFSKIKIGDTTLLADSPTDTVTLNGTNINITADGTNDIITFKVNDATTGQKGVVQLVDSITEDTYKVPTSKAIKDALFNKVDSSALTGKIDVVKINPDKAGNLTTLTATGHIQDSGKAISNFILTTDVSSTYNSNGTAPVNGKAVFGALSALNIQNSTGGSSLQQSKDPSSKYAQGIELYNSTEPQKSKNLNAVELVDEYGTHIGNNTGVKNLNLRQPQPADAIGEFSAVFGGVASAQGKRAFACGTNTIAIGKYSFATGDNSVTLGNDSFAANCANTAYGNFSASFGVNSVAYGESAFTVGAQNMALGSASFAGGTGSISSGEHSFTFGNTLKASANNQAVFGKFNRPIDSEEGALFIVGNGEKVEDVECLSNAMEVTKDGHIKVYHRDLNNNTADTSLYLDMSYDEIYSTRTFDITVLSDLNITSQSSNIKLTGYTIDIHSGSGMCLNNNRIFGLGTPIYDNDATNKQYVDSKVNNKIGYATSVPTTAKEIEQGPEFLVIIEE